MNYDEMLKKLGPTIKAIVKKVNRKYSYCSDDDFYQEAVLHLWQECQTNKLEDKTDSYILQGIYFFLKNYMRKVSKTVDVNSVSLYRPPAVDGPGHEDELVDDLETPDGGETIDGNLLFGEVEECLDEKEKKIFHRKMEGYTTREIGDMFGVSHVMVVKMANKVKDKCGHLRKEMVCC